ncbi:MAG: hypothetical protein U5N86_10745 [Planctomycetota bacterium]|nr:hypothetical protein [Planctomycetota bacterium]
MKMNIVDKRPDTMTYTIDTRERATDKLRPLVIWNSATGMTVVRFRASAQHIDRGTLGKDYFDTPAHPCGVDARIPESPEETVFIAPTFDFSCGCAGWKAQVDQPGLQVRPDMKRNKRKGIEVTSRFCGSRLGFESPEMNIDARVWQQLEINYRSDEALSFYVHSGHRKFRVLLSSGRDDNRADYAIPVSSRYVTKNFGGAFSTVKVDLMGMFEEYLNLESAPVVTGLSIERFQLSNGEHIGVLKQKLPSFSLSSISFNSTYRSEPEESTLECPSPSLPVKMLADYKAGLGLNSVELDTNVLKRLDTEREGTTYKRRNGALAVDFDRGFQSLTPVGSTEETQMFRQRIDGESYLTINKTQLHGYFGVQILPEPIPVSKYSDVCVKVRGDVQNYYLAAKADMWRFIPLNKGTTINVKTNKRTGTVSRAGANTGVLILTDGEVTFLHLNLNEIKQMTGSTVVEEIYIMSGFKQVVPAGEMLAISSVLFYNPSKVAKFSRTARSPFDQTIKSLFKGERTYKTIKVGKVLTMARVTEGGYDPEHVREATLSRCDKTALVFDIDNPVSLDDMRITIGARTLPASVLHYGINDRQIVVLREEVYNAEAGSVPWKVEMRYQNYWKNLGEGSAEMPDARAVRVRRLQTVPDDALYFEDYENGLGYASSRRTAALLSGGDPFMGSQALEGFTVVKHSFSNYLFKRKYDAVRYPYISFAYKMRDANLTFYFRCEGHYKDTRFSPVKKKIPLSVYKNEFMRIGPEGANMTLGIFGKIPGVVSDGKWHTTQFEVMPLLEGKPFNGHYFIKEVGFRASDIEPLGSWVSLDNFCIFGNNAKSFTVNIEPPMGFEKAKMEYEWVLLDSMGRNIGAPGRTSETSFDVELPRDKHGLSLSVRIVLDGKPSSYADVQELMFTR